MKSIAINGRFLAQNVITGVERYAHEILRALDQVISETQQTGYQIDVLAPQNALDLPQLAHFRLRRVGKLRGHAWEQLELPIYCHDKVLFTPCGGAPIVHPRNIITIPDAAVFASPNAYSFLYGSWYRWLHKRLCKTALHVFTVSEFSKSELVRWCAADPSKVSVTYLGCEHINRVIADPAVLTKHNLRTSEYVLAVSSRNSNKNFHGILQAITLPKLMNVQFALAGGFNQRVFKQPLQLSGSVKQLAYVTDAELKALYMNAACFVFPSFYEGFGLPPLEAISLGCPIVVSSTASLPEVFKEAGIYCAPENSNDIADKILDAIASNGPDRAILLANYSKRYNWRRCAELTWQEIVRMTVS